MASIKSILKTTLNLNHKCTKILSCEEKVVEIQRFGETFDQLQIFAHCEPTKNQVTGVHSARSGAQDMIPSVTKSQNGVHRT